MQILTHFFHYGDLPANAMQGTYDMQLVALSYIVAVLASYVALSLVGRLRKERRFKSILYWIVGGAFTMGAGIWSMHFIGMLAFVMPHTMFFDLHWTVASLIVAIFASGSALYVLQLRDLSFFHLGISGLFIGLAIAGMHYIGMAGMEVGMDIHYRPSLFILSILIAVLAGETALWLALESNKGNIVRQNYLKVLSALIMGFAICGMHYTGMFAAIFTPLDISAPDLEPIIPVRYLAFFIAGITAFIIAFALMASSYYRKMISAVENEKEFLNAMLDNLKDGIIACDEKGRITVLNKALQKNIPTLPKGPLTIAHLREHLQLFSLDNKRIEEKDYPIIRALNGEIIRDMSCFVKFKDGSVLDVMIDGTDIKTAEGKHLGAVVVVHNVTEIKRSEKLKNEFVSIVSHELRTPLTSIRGALGLLSSNVMGHFSDKAQKLIEIANNNCERLLLLINDILDIEKIEAGKMDFELTVADINTIVMDAVNANKMYALKFDVNLVFTPLNKSVPVIVDVGRLMQVLTNLLSNACKFSPAGQEVIVTLEVKKGFVRTSIKNAGPGIPDAFKSRVFQKFSQADASNTRGKGGTGLGLSISKTIIEKLGGFIDFKTSKQGTIFYFDLPLSQETKKIKEKNSDNKKNIKVNDEKQYILICEDDNDQSSYLRVLLEAANFRIDVSETVHDAKALIQKNQYDILLLDLILPDQDGIAFIRELRANPKTKTLPIIVLSVIAQTGQILLNGEVDPHMSFFDKPLDFKKLLLAIHRLRT